MGRRRIDDGVNVVALQHLAELVEYFRPAKLLRRLASPLRIHIADRNDIPKRCGLLGVATPLPSATDQRDTRPVIRRQRIRRFRRLESLR